MKTQNKKRKSKTSNQKIVYTRNKKLFEERMKKVIQKFGNNEAFKLLSNTELKILHQTRIRPIRVIRSEKNSKSIYNRSLKAVNNDINYLLRNNFVMVNSMEVNLYDFIVEIENLYYSYRNCSKQFQKYFRFFETKEFEEEREEAYKKIHICISAISQYISQPTKFTAHIRKIIYNESKNSLSTLPCFNDYAIDIKDAPSKKILIENHKRTMYQLLLNDEEFTPIVVKGDILNIPTIKKEQEFKVYIQNHVMNRIIERLGAPYSILAYSTIVFAMRKEPIPINEGNKLLFPMSYKNIKVGYLVGKICNSDLCIRTFLFLTNGGTPEGDLLAELLGGMNKTDMKYIGLDKLASIINSDIKSSPELVEIFENAGCGDLFKLEEILQFEDSECETVSAQFLKNYISI
jgi:hypothetical protein